MCKWRQPEEILVELNLNCPPRMFEIMKAFRNGLITEAELERIKNHLAETGRISLECWPNQPT